MILAFERYRALVTIPVERFNAALNSNRYSWKKIFLKYFAPVLVVSVSFNLPRFFETQLEERIEVMNEFNKEKNLSVKVNYQKSPKEEKYSF